MPPANGMISSNIIRDAFGIDIAVKRHPVTTVSFAFYTVIPILIVISAVVTELEDRNLFLLKTI